MPVDVWEQGTDVLVRIYVQPGAQRTECAGEHGNAIRVRIAAPARDNKANAALIEFVADRLGVSKQRVSIKAGHSSRKKTVIIAGACSADVVRELMG